MSNQKDKKNIKKNTLKIKNAKAFFGNSYYKSEYDYKNDKDFDKEDKLKEEIFNSIFDNFFNREISNFSLLLSKLIPILDIAVLKEIWEKKDDEEIKKIKEIDLNWYSLKGVSLDEESKKIFLEKFIEKSSYSFNKNTLMNYINSLISELEKQNYKTIYNKSLPTFSTLICGLGSTSVLETSITLHHIWGVPYIPGSSLKGVCRTVAFWKLVESKKIKEEKWNDFQNQFYGNLNLEDNEMLVYQLLFGAQDFRGLLLFLDVYPNLLNDKTPFRLDIMNPHYQDYYGNDSGKTPGDWENPVPIYFLTVKEGVSFQFTILFDDYRWEKVKEKWDKAKNKVEEIVNNNKFFEEILKEALSFYGLGSKTRLGYGSFKV